MRQSDQESELVTEVRSLLAFRLENRHGSHLPGIADLSFGKMLRTRYGASLIGGDRAAWPAGIIEACAAVELVHTASLYHDDVIDGASVRRGMPTLWRTFSTSGAILTGDVLFCESFKIMLESHIRPFIDLFIDKIHEVCAAEADQELILRGARVDENRCIDLGRRKTGPLFAFIGRICGAGDEELAQTLEEAGYRVGTAYQLADDLMDEVYREEDTGKTMGTDRLRNKFTLAHDDQDLLKIRIESLCDSIQSLLCPWPALEPQLRAYIDAMLPTSTSKAPPALPT